MITTYDLNEDILTYENCKTYRGLLFDSSDNVVRTYPFYFDVHLPKTLHDEYCSKIKEKFIFFEEPVFFANYPWSWNYQNNYVEILPQILLYIKLLKKNPTLYFIYYNFKDIYEYIFNIYNLDIKLLMHPGCNNYIYKKVYISRHIEKYRNFNENIGEECMLMTNTIRDYLTNKFKDKIDNTLNKLIYINRENNLSGHNRFIINNSEVINCVLDNSFEIITFEQMSL